MSRDLEPGDRVRSLDDEHRARPLLGTVDDVGGSVPDGVSVVEVTWDDGRHERRLGEEVALAEAPPARATTSLEQCLEWAATSHREGETIRGIEMSHYAAVRTVRPYFGVTLWLHRGGPGTERATCATGFGDTTEAAAAEALRFAERDGFFAQSPAPERIGVVAQRVLDELETADPQREAAQ